MSKNKSSTSAFTLNILLWIVYLIYIVLFQKHILSSFIHSLDSNFFVYTWNIIFAIWSTNSIIRLIVIPVWKFIFIDTNKFGQKLEWYDEMYKHMKPSSDFIGRRWQIVFLLGVAFYLMRFFPVHIFQYYSLDYAALRDINYHSVAVADFFYNNFLILYFISPPITILWCFLSFEGRTRLIARIIERKIKLKWKDKKNSNLPKNPFDKNSDIFNISIFSSFSDERGNISKSLDDKEDWVLLNETCLRANILAIGPIGSGKTSGVIKPILEQAIIWNSENADLKASMLIVDPKATLLDYIIEIARSCQRENDIILLKLGGELSLNPIAINDIWRDDSAFKVAGWILSAWQNFQNKSSPEPYWENQNFLLIRNVLMLLYLEKGKETTIYDISKNISFAVGGVYHKNKDTNKNTLTPFGEMVLKYQISIIILKKLLGSPSVTIKSKLQTTTLTEKNEGGIGIPAFENIRQLKEYLNSIDISKSELMFDVFNAINEFEIDITTKDMALFHENLFKSASERISVEKKLYKKYIENLVMNTNPQLLELKSQIMKDSNRDTVILTKYKSMFHKIVDEEFNKKYGGKSVEAGDLAMQLILDESVAFVSAFVSQFADLIALKSAVSLSNDSLEWILNSWAKSIPETRSSIVSNVEPFLKMFETPKIAKVLSPTNSIDQISLENLVLEGKIIFPCFPQSDVGKDLANGMITLIKNRWQEAVLSTMEKKRIKLQVIDEYQRVATLAMEKATGDFEYCELSREFGGCTILATQSLSAIKQKANKESDFDKIHGVLRTIINFPTNDPHAISFIQKIAGKKEKTKVTKTVTEGAQAPTLENISEKFSSADGASNLSISYTESKNQEDVIETSEIQEAEAWTGLGIIYNGQRSEIKTLAFKPDFWPHKRQKWSKMKEFNFNPMLANDSTPSPKVHNSRFIGLFLYAYKFCTFKEERV